MLSVIIITKNEAFHIQRCLKSVSWADEIIILDSGSNDDTVAICKQFTHLVFIKDWPGFGLQKQRALEIASHEWVLSIDADEEVSESLKQEIQEAIKNTTANGFEIPRLSSYCGKQIKHGSWWPDYVLRLFRRESGKFSNDIVHERVLITGPTKKLKNPIFHESYINHEEVITKLNSYSSLGAEKLYISGRKSTLYGAIGKGLWTFFKDYLLRFGFLDGEEGLMLAVSNAETTYYKYLKLRYLLKNNKTI